MAAVTKRGKAVVDGLVGIFDLIVYPLAQTGKMSANFEEETVKDAHGFDVSWIARNLHYLNDFAFKLVGDTQSHAISGGVFIAPFATVTLSGFDLAAFNGTYQNVSGQDIDLANTKVGDMSVKLRRYDDAAQNTLATSAPA